MGNLAGDRKTHSIKKDLEGIEPSRLSGVPICRSELAPGGAPTMISLAPRVSARASHR
jgi:hypothetical protein